MSAQKFVLGRRELLCGCCAAVASAALPRLSVAAAWDDPPPVERAAFHTEVFENDLVRFLNARVPAGKTAPFHRHSLDFAQFVIEAGEGIEVTLPGEAAKPVHFTPGELAFTAYGEHPLVHEVANKGTTDLHIMGIEIRPSAAGRFTASTRAEAPAYRLALDNDRLRGWRLVLQAGEEAGRITQGGPGVRMVLKGGEIVEIGAEGNSREYSLGKGDFAWQEAGSTRAVKNVGTTTVEYAELELK